MRRVYPISATVVLLAAGFGLAGATRATPAMAASCYGFSCHGYDPASTGCNKYYSTYKETDGALASVVNWYSTGCNANWAQGWLSASAYAAGDSMIVYATTTDSHNPPLSEYMCYPGPGNTGKLDEFCNGVYRGTSASPAYTDMVDGTNMTQAIVIVYDHAGNYITQYEADQ
jgi:hypothetical protein